METMQVLDIKSSLAYYTNKDNYINTGPLRGMCKICALCRKNPVKYISCDAICIFCEECGEIFKEYLSLHNHTWEITEIPDTCVLRFKLMCSDKCMQIGKFNGELPIECEVLLRLEDINFHSNDFSSKTNKSKNSTELFQILINALKEKCSSEDCFNKSNCLVINRFFDPTIDYIAIGMCYDCFEKYSLKHEFYPSHEKFCGKKECHCEDAICEYDWEKQSACIETGRDDHQIFCESDCIHFRELVEQ